MRICFVGDSFVAGVGDPGALGWTGRICASARRAGWDITGYNLGVRRETSDDIARRWEREVTCRLSDEFPALVIFSFGTNDTTEHDGRVRVSVDESVDNAQSILMGATSRYAVLMAGPPPVPDPLQSQRNVVLSDAYSALCTRLNVPYLDVHASLGQSQTWISEAIAWDGAHPGSGGYAAYAEMFSAWQPWQDQLRRADRLFD